MLVLSRHRDESIIIGDDIVITVVDIRGDKVRLGIAAPIEISVHRQEVYEAIQRENRQASRLDPQDARQLERLNPPSGATSVAPAPTRIDPTRPSTPRLPRSGMSCGPQSSPIRPLHLTGRSSRLPRRDARPVFLRIATK